MKKLILIGILALTCVLKAQNLDSLIKSYNPSQTNLIERNWCQFFKEDLSTLYKTKNLYSIRLDSYGLIFPSTNLFSNISTDNMRHNGQREIENTKYSIVNIFGNRSLRKKLILNKLNPSDKDKFYDSLAMAVGPNKLNLEKFNELWRKYHNDRTIAQINNLIDSLKYTKVIFYCHGYNVPYSLAALQFEYIIEEFKLDDGKTLFIPIYWPSNDAKKFKYRKDGTLNYDDRKSPKNAARFLYYSNEAYFAGLTLRNIINGLSDKVIVKIVSHSLGATVSSAALIDFTGKLQPHKPGCDMINNQLKLLMASTPIPERKILVYMSAAAIPGIGTFNGVTQRSRNHVFYCSWNPCDHVLNKDFLHVKVGPNKLGGTELGMDGNGSINQVTTFMNSQFPNSFIPQKVFCQKDHDIFSYLRITEYKRFMQSFLNSH